MHESPDSLHRRTAFSWKFSALTAALGFTFGLAACDKKKPGGAKPEKSSAPITAPAPAAGAWKVALLPETWTLSGFAEDKDLSGMDSWDGTRCVVCSDELRFIQTGLIANHRITAGTQITLLPGDGAEMDAEGVVAVKADNCYYVTGSHGVAKKTGELQPSRLHVAKVPVDPATGEPLPRGAQLGSLMPWIRNEPALGPFVGRSLQEDGFNIEGLTWKDGKLWFGVRAPNAGGDGFVIEAEAASIFTESPRATLHRLALGAGVGIREIAAVRDGFLIAAGEALSDVGPDNEFRLFFWKPASAPEFIGVLPSPSGKAEGLYVLKQEEKTLDVLVIFDGVKGGGPKAYRITQP